MDESKVKCSRCHCWRNKMEYVKNDKVLKSCVSCRQNDAKQREKQKCEHKRRRDQCIECGGSGICEHKRQRSKCVECGGGSVCEHKRQRSLCIECGGSGICEHKRQRSQCIECGGASICEHKRQRSKCVECGGSEICEHKRQRRDCIECGGSQICEHKRQRRFCIECGGANICEHKRIRSRCIECDGSQVCIHKRQRSLCQICNFNLCLVNKQRNYIKRCFQYTSLKKTKSSIQYLGCDINTFIRHMEKKLTDDMTWDNIHIDHIKPVSRFNLDIEEEFNKCCHYTNLQPLLAKDNMNKHNKWTDENEVFWNEHIIYKDYDKIYL